jgi:hypothetical protein
VRRPSQRAERAALIDILPNHDVWTHTSKEWALRSWYWALMAQPYDLPERMLAAVPAQWYIEKKLSKPGIGLGFFDLKAFAEYVRCFDWKTIEGSCADYRACATCDFAMDEDPSVTVLPITGHLVEAPLLRIGIGPGSGLERVSQIQIDRAPTPRRLCGLFSPEFSRSQPVLAPPRRPPGALRAGGNVRRPGSPGADRGR